MSIVKEPIILPIISIHSCILGTTTYPETIRFFFSLFLITCTWSWWGRESIKKIIRQTYGSNQRSGLQSKIKKFKKKKKNFSKTKNRAGSETIRYLPLYCPEREATIFQATINFDAYRVHLNANNVRAWAHMHRCAIHA